MMKCVSYRELNLVVLINYQQSIVKKISKIRSKTISACVQPVIYPSEYYP